MVCEVQRLPRTIFDALQELARKSDVGLRVVNGPRQLTSLQPPEPPAVERIKALDLLIAQSVSLRNGARVPALKRHGQEVSEHCRQPTFRDLVVKRREVSAILLVLVRNIEHGEAPRF